MKFDKNGFYKYNGNVIEGYIGDDIKSLDKVRLVFILREPNSGNNEADTFWFKNTVESAEKEERLDRYQNVYYNKLGKIACLLLNKGDDIQNALKQCAYINLYPVKGGKEASEQYQKVFNAFKKKDFSNDFANSRWNIINNLPNGCKILTLGEIFGAISKKAKNEQSLIENANGIGYLYIERNGIQKRNSIRFLLITEKGNLKYIRFITRRRVEETVLRQRIFASKNNLRSFLS